MFIIFVLPLGLFIILEIFLLLNRTINKFMDITSIWLIIDLLLIALISSFHFLDAWNEMPPYFWIFMVIWILIHYFIIRQFFEIRKMY